jgi:putative oxidoreductase
VSLSVYLSTTAKKGDKVASEVATVPGHNNLKRHSTETTFMSNTNNIVILVARVLLSFMFILAGFGKLTDPAGTAGMIAGAGLPASTALTYLAGAFEFVTGLAVLVGYQTKIVGWLLAAFCIFTAVVFHLPTVNVPDFPAAALGWINALNQIMVMKNFTLAGAYIFLAIVGPGLYSLDARRGAYAVA